MVWKRMKKDRQHGSLKPPLLKLMSLQQLINVDVTDVIWHLIRAIQIQVLEHFHRLYRLQPVEEKSNQIIPQALYGYRDTKQLQHRNNSFTST